MNWAQFKDPVSHMCLAAAAVACWSLAQEVAGWQVWVLLLYRSGTVNSKSFVNKYFLQNKWKYELTVHFKHEMIGKHFTEVELRINRVRINRVRPVMTNIFVTEFSEFSTMYIRTSTTAT